MWYIERTNDKGDWVAVMYGPHRLRIDDVRGPPGPAADNHLNGAFYMNGWPSPGNKSIFAGKKGSQARVRYGETVVELYDWAQVLEDELNPDSRMVWGWKLAEQRHAEVPFEQMWPLSFVG